MNDLNEYLQPKTSDNNAPITKVSDFVTAELIDRNYDLPAGKINYTHITPSSRIYSAIVSLSGEVGTFKDIQLALNYVGRLGGGSVFVKNGIYTITSDLIVPQGVSLIGETSSNVVIDFNNTAFQIIASGDKIYDIGVIAVNNNSTSVIGIGTIWDSTLEGKYMMIRGSNYLIHQVIDTTNIVLDNPFSGDNITNESYIISDPLFGTFISNMTIQNSLNPTGAVYFEYTSGVIFTNFNIFTSTLGFTFKNSEVGTFNNWGIFFCDSGCVVYNFSQFSIDSVYIANIFVGDAFSITNGNTISLFNWSVFGAVGRGMVLTNCYNYAILDYAIISCTGVGLDLINTYDGQITTGNIMNNTSDGIRESAFCNRNIISNNLIRNNGGWGIDITSAADTYTLISSCILANNTSGSITDLGQFTKIRSCIGQADN